MASLNYCTVHLLLNIGAVSSLEKNDFLKDIFTHVSWYICKKSLSSFPLASMFISNFNK